MELLRLREGRLPRLPGWCRRVPADPLVASCRDDSIGSRRRALQYLAVSGGCRQFSSKRRVHHRAPRMFDLVADVAAYPESDAVCSEHPPAIQNLTATSIVIADMRFRSSWCAKAFQPGDADRPNLKISSNTCRGRSARSKTGWPRAQVGRRLRCRVFPAYEFKSRCGDADGHDVRHAFRVRGAFEKRADAIMSGPGGGIKK